MPVIGGLLCQLTWVQFLQLLGYELSKERNSTVSMRVIVCHMLQTRSRDFDFVFDVASHSQPAVRIRDLLSRMFEKAWQAGVNGQTTDENTVLRHVIMWPSFHRFIGLFCQF